MTPVARNRIIAAFMMATVVFGIILSAAINAHAAYNDDTRYRWEHPRTICVQSNLGSGWSSDDAAVEEFRDLGPWVVKKKSGYAACLEAGWAKRIILTKVYDPDVANRAWINWERSADMRWGQGQDGRWGWMLQSPVYIEINTAVKGRTWYDNKKTWMHELFHAVAGPMGGHWPDDSGHTDWCESIVTSDGHCYYNKIGAEYTTFDKNTIARVYDPWGL